MTHTARLSLGILLLATTSGRAEEAQTPPSFPSDVELVTIDAVVLDGKGNLVTGLTQDEFVVMEDKQPQSIVSFEAFTQAAPSSGKAKDTPIVAGAPLDSRTPLPQGRPFAMIVDDLRIAPLLVTPMRRAVTSFLETSLRYGDDVTLTTSSDDVHWHGRIPEERTGILRALDRIRGQDWSYGDTEAGYAGDSAAIREYRAFQGLRARQDMSTPGSGRTGAEVADARRRARMERTLGAIHRTLDGWNGLRGRKSLVLLSEGFLQDGGRELQDVAARAREANAAIYFIDVLGLQTPPEFSAEIGLGEPSNLDGQGALERATRLGERAVSLEERVGASGGAVDLADVTGGFSVRDNGIVKGLHRAAAESRVFYLLGFQPPGGKPVSAWRDLRVEVTRPGLEVRARKGYRLRASASRPANPTTGTATPDAGEGQAVALQASR
jgi:VWFA-related protein